MYTSPSAEDVPPTWFVFLMNLFFLSTDLEMGGKNDTHLQRTHVVRIKGQKYLFQGAVLSNDSQNAIYFVQLSNQKKTRIYKPVFGASIERSSITIHIF